MSDPESGQTSTTSTMRRRWITLGETIAVLAVTISALTLWLNWSERSGSEAEKAAESARASTRAGTLVLSAQTAAGGARLDLRPASVDQVIQEQTIRFPAALGVDPVETTGEPRIEARWFDAALERARDKAGLPDDSRGDERLPLLIETRFLVDGRPYEDRSLYDVGYTIEGRLLTGHDVTLRGLSLVRRVKADGATAALDARWKSLVPEKDK